MQIEIIPGEIQYEPKLEGETTLNSGIVDFRLKIDGVFMKRDFTNLTTLLTESIATAVCMFERTVRYTERRGID
ncbi:hypothetical protein AGMMS49944_03780 [Spirochaetia bacterium]|nr:hypothetical protein AGMMS49944_03780 [Spirochaetia bacterium]